MTHRLLDSLNGNNISCREMSCSCNNLSSEFACHLLTENNIMINYSVPKKFMPNF